jgi:hypothetical protein
MTARAEAKSLAVREGAFAWSEPSKRTRGLEGNSAIVQAFGST